MRLLEISYFITVIFAVVPFGSVYPATLSIDCIAFGGLTLISLFKSTSIQSIDTVKAQISILTLILITWCLLQSWQFPGNPFGNPIWIQEPHAGNGISSAISVNPAATRKALLKIVAPSLAALAALNIFENDTSAHRLWRFLTHFSAILICLSLLQFVIFPGTILIYKKWAYEYDFTSTFVNRNTAATFVGVALTLNVGSLIKASTKISFKGLFNRIFSFGLWGSTRYRRFIYKVCVTSCILIALFLTGSRAGIVSTLIALFIIATLVVFRRPPSFSTSSRIRILVTITAAAGAIAATIWFLGGIAIERVAEYGVVDTARLCTYQSTWNAIKDNFWTGTGFGTFADVFPAYRNPQCSGLIGLWQQAHNSYLEFILGVGVIGYAIIPTTIAIVARPLIVNLTTPNSLAIEPLIALAALLLIALHATVDFSIQIPGFAIFSAAALAAGIRLAFKGASQL